MDNRYRYSRYKLGVLIATVEERKEQFDILQSKFSYQSENIDVILISDCDNKEKSIGKKRQNLLEAAKNMNCEWIVFFDDDDLPSENYIQLILDTINSNPDIDCIGINGTMTTNGSNPQTWCHVLGEIWRDGSSRDKFTYYRPIIHFNPVKLELALKAGFKDMRYGEDRDYSDRLNPLLKKMAYIEQPLFHYNYSNKIEHKKKYGIK